MQTAVGSYWDNSKLSSSRLACRPRMFHWIIARKATKIKPRFTGYSVSEFSPPSTSESTLQSGHLCVEGDGLFLACPSFLKMKRTTGVRVPPALTCRGYCSISTSVASWLRWGGFSVFFCIILVAIDLHCLTINFDWHRGIGSLWPSQFGLYSYRNRWFLAALCCCGGWARNDRSFSSFGGGICWLLRKGSLSGIWKRNISLHFELLYPLFKLPFRASSRRRSMFAFAVNAQFLVTAVGSFMANLPTFQTCSRVFARSRAAAIYLAVETAQRVRDIRVHRDPHLAGRDVFRRLRRTKRQYHRVSVTFAVSISDVNDHGSGHSMWA